MLGSREPEIIRSFTRVWIGASASKTSVVSVGATRPLTRMASPTSPPRLTRETIRRGLPSRLPSFVDPQPRVFTVDEGPAPGLLDSDTAYEIAEAGGGATVRSTTGVQLESVALTMRLRESAPLWAFRYGDDANPDRLIVILDALNGDVLWTGAPTAGQ